ncbi:MAG: hypothetical protein AAF408_06145, partial [Pseudomonadota bacterium]
MRTLRQRIPAQATLGAALTVMFLICQSLPGLASEITPFLGIYSGSAEVQNVDGTGEKRDMSVEIAETSDGFNVSWSTLAYKPDGRLKESAFSIDFLPTDRNGIFSAAMKRNVF